MARIRRLAEDLRSSEVEKLSGLARYRVRQGDHRVIYAIDDTGKAIITVKIGHRREVNRNRG